MEYGATPLGEGQVAAFQAAQYVGGFHSLVVSWVTAHVVFYDSAKLRSWIGMLNCAFGAGRKALPFYGIPWERYYGENIGSLRDRFISV